MGRSCSFDEFEAIAQKHSGEIELTCQVLDLSQELRGIQKGVVFVLATWSMPAIVSIKHRMGLLAKIDLQDVGVYVIDSDVFGAEDYRECFHEDFACWGGWGERLWLHQGEVFGEPWFRFPKEDRLFIENTMKLIEM
ncbi:MAG: hypothetical protein ACYTGQ_10955 [Planctomycetota bacterium]